MILFIQGGDEVLIGSDWDKEDRGNRKKGYPGVEGGGKMSAMIIANVKKNFHRSLPQMGTFGHCN